MALLFSKSLSLVAKATKSTSSSSLSSSRFSGKFFSTSHGHDNHASHDAHGHGSHAKVSRTVEEPHLFPFQEGDYIPPTETHAVGDEKWEIDFGDFDQTTLKGHFGTKDKPVEVLTRFESRIVGCTGSEEEEHDILWHQLQLGKNLVCMECGQYFQLKQHPDAAHGHGHGHGEEEFHGHVDGDGFRFVPPPKTQAQIAKEKAERDEELKKDPKAPVKQVKSSGVDYHEREEKTDEGRLSSKAPYFHDRRTQEYKDRQ